MPHNRKRPSRPILPPARNGSSWLANHVAVEMAWFWEFCPEDREGWCDALDETSEIEERQVADFAWALVQAQGAWHPPEAFLRVRVLARMIHALHLHRQMMLAPPPGCLDFPPVPELTWAQWAWLVLDSWSLENQLPALCYMLTVRWKR